MKKIKTQLTIFRPQSGDGRKRILIRVEDRDSQISFLDIEIGLEDFAECLTGLSGVECEGIIRGLENVGKTKEREKFEFELPEHNYSNQKENAVKEGKRLTPEGWTLEECFSSQSSFCQKDGKTWARTDIFRYVETPNT